MEYIIILMSRSIKPQSQGQEENPYKRATISLLQAANWLNGEIAVLLSPLNLSLQQLKVLAIIYEEPTHKATVNTIRDNMMDPMSNVSRLLNKLMEKKLIEKVRDLEDQRIVHIHITDSGINLMRQGRDLMDAGLRALCALSPKEIAQMERLMEKLRFNCRF